MSGITEKRRKYLRDYIQEKYKVIHLSFHKEKDKDILDFLESKGNKIAYVRKLIEEDVASLSKLR